MSGIDNNIKLGGRDQDIAVTLILIFIFVAASLAILSKGSHGGEDDISHYRIARLAFSNPELYLDLWGKPLFTLPASLFARFGYNGVKIMNVLLSALAMLVSFRVASQLKLRYSWSVIILAGCAPLYLALSYSGMTEILFSFIAVTAMWAGLKGRHVIMLLLLSFLPFARMEGFLLWIPIIVALVMERRYRLIPLLATGFLLFSLAGAIIFDDLFWIVNRFPYKGSDLYGSGPFFHFVSELPRIIGVVMILPLLIGLGAVVVGGKKVLRVGEKEYFLTWYVLLPAFLYFAAHSFVWWMGKGNSAGLIRVVAGIIPLLAIVSVYGIDRLVLFLDRWRIATLPVVLFLMAGVVVEGLTRYPHPAPLSEEQQLVKDAVKWLRDSNLTGNKVYYYNPFYIILSGVNPSDTHSATEKVPDSSDPAEGVGEGEIVIWDSHFAPAEGRLPESDLAESGDYNLLASFGGKYGEGGTPRVALYIRETGVSMVIAREQGLEQRLDQGLGQKQGQGLDQRQEKRLEQEQRQNLRQNQRQRLEQRQNLGQILRQNQRQYQYQDQKRDQSQRLEQELYTVMEKDSIVIDFSRFRGLKEESFVKDIDGSPLYLLKKRDLFSPSLELLAGELISDGYGLSIHGEATLFIPGSIRNDDVLLVLSLDRSGKSVIYNKQDFSQHHQGNGFFTCSVVMELDERMRSGDIISLYIWNKGRAKLYINSFRAIIYKKEN